MKRKILLVLVFAIIVGIVSVCYGAPTPSPRSQVGQDNANMRQNLAWLTEGLNILGKSSDAKLALKPAQKKKILTVFQVLIDNKLVLMEMPPERQSGQNQQHRQYDPNDPEVQSRIKKLKDQTVLGNQQADKIDAVLTEAQRSFIDNLDFKAEKYGFIDFRKLFGSSQGGSQGGSQTRPDPAVMSKIRGQIRAGQELLVKLNNEVLKMLKS